MLIQYLAQQAGIPYTDITLGSRTSSPEGGVLQVGGVHNTGHIRTARPRFRLKQAIYLSHPDDQHLPFAVLFRRSLASLVDSNGKTRSTTGRINPRIDGGDRFSPN